MALAMLLALVGGATTSVIASAPRAAAVDSATAINGAIAWAKSHEGQIFDDGLCLTFVHDAYANAGENIGTGYSNPINYWNAHNDTKHHDENAPAGALVFWDANPYNSDGHVALSLGGGNVISTYERGDHTVHEFMIADRNSVSTYSSTYLGWMMPPGISDVSNTPKDTDGDGVTDDVDQCVAQAGPASNNGCPVTDSDGDGVVDSSDACKTMPGATTNRGCRMDGHTVSGNFTGDSKTDAITFYDYGSDNLGAFLETGSSAGLSKPVGLWSTGAGQWTWANSYFVAGNFAGNDSWTDVIGLYDYGNGKLGAFLFQGNGSGVSQAVHLWTTSNNTWSLGSAKYVVGNFSGNDGRDDIMAFYGYSGSNMGVFVFPGNGSGVSQNVGEWTTGPNQWNIKSAEFVAGNFAGNDGYTDVMALYDYGSSNTGAFLFQGGAGNIGQPQGLWTTGANNWNVKSGQYTVGDYNHDGKDDIVALYDLTNSNLGAFIFPGNGNGVSQNQLLWTTGAGQWNLSSTKMVAGNFGSGPSLFTFYNYGSSNTGGALLPSTSAGFGQPQGGWATGAGQWNWLCM